EESPGRPQATAKARPGRRQSGTEARPAESAPSSEPPAWSREWVTAEGIDRPGGVSLRLDHPERALTPGGVREGDGSAGLVREKSREERLAAEKAIVGRRLDNWASDLKAKQRAEARDAYSQSLEDALARGFNPGWDVLGAGSPGTPSSTFQAFVA